MTKVLLAGCGKMGSAMLAGWLSKLNDPLSFTIVDPMISPDHPAASHPAASHPGASDSRVTILTALDDSIEAPDIIVLAMKPQMMPDALPGLAKIASADTVWLSIAAGVTMAKLKQQLGQSAAIIRTMPNTPAAIGLGVTAMIMDDQVPADVAQLAVRMMEVIGDVVMLDHEDDMDSVTGVSGSGPAYVFLMREALEEAAIAAGLTPELAAKLAAATLTGAVGLMNESDETPSQLRVNVTSPAGTTQAALDVLMADDGLPALMRRAVLAARDRSRELGK
ncbi:MAG: pyrroline-5-carboxylate reductase [Alphaproteobacteria bacterium]|nr:pyrroline-5-carboxylate reductase [Alphaproteobacteria bacterium]